MSIKLKGTDHIVYFWYAENADKESFLMILRKYPHCWQLDWRFRYEHYSKYYSTISGLQTPEAEAIEIGRGAHQKLLQQYPLKQIFQRVDGTPERFRIMLKEYGLHT